MSDGPIRVMIVDDHFLVRMGLVAVLAGEPWLQVVGEAENACQALECLNTTQPHVALVDLRLPGMDGVSLSAEIRRRSPGTRVIVLSTWGGDEDIFRSLKAGASGYLVKSAADRELVDAVRAVARGETYVQQNAGHVLARGFLAKDPAGKERARFDRLTDREREVLVLIARGYSAPEIGERLSISSKTVDTYKQRVNEKLGVAHRADYVRIAMRLGLLAED